ncbi:hypothetical protein O9929_27785 [Vibrio lentus]|nr:hypothetical protein [Vibrio lentus]
MEVQPGVASTYGALCVRSSGSKPLLLERDNNVPPLVVPSEELRTVHRQVLNGCCSSSMNQGLVYA